MEDTQRSSGIVGFASREENDALIEEMLAKAEEAPEPGSGERVIHRGDDNQPAPMTFASLTSAGWVYIYETKDGERSLANRNNLKMLLNIKNKDGTRRFTLQQPPYAPKQGTMKCLLHADSPDRAHYDEMGLVVCRKSNMKNRFAVTQHMKKRHPQEWLAIEQERIEAEKQEERDWRRSLVEMNQPQAQPVIEQPVIPQSFTCKKCGREFGTKQGMKLHMRRHK